jgi:hypothetical protein
LLLGVAQALSAGPRDAVEMMARGLSLPSGTGHLVVLERLTNARGPLAGAAGFDAAYVLELVPPPGDPRFWRDLAERYERAAPLLAASDDKTRALERAKAAKDTAAALAPPR